MKSKLEPGALIKDYKKSELILEGEKSILEMITSGNPLNEILDAIALHYEALAENSICSILLINKEGTHVKHGAGPSLPEAYNQGIDSEPIGPVAGSCGTAAFRKERVVVSDIASDPLWINYRDFALSFGLRACWSSPIMGSSDNVLGTFAIYYSEPRNPTPEDIALIDRISNLAKIALKKYYKEIQLKESEEKYRSTLQRITDGFVALDNNLQFTYANKSSEVLLGREAETLIGKYAYKEFPEAVGSSIHRAIIKAIEEQQYIHIEDYYDPYRRWFESHIYPSSEGVSIYFRDITKRKKSESEILKERNLSNSIINSLPGIFYHIEGDGNYIRWNRQKEIISGYSSEEMSKMNALQFFDEDDRELIRAKMGEVLRMGSANVEARLLTKDNRKIWYYFSAVAADYEGRKTILGTGIDISDQKHSSESLKESEEKYRTLVEQAADGIFVVDQQSLQFTEANKRICDLLGYTAEELSRKRMVDVVWMDPGEPPVQLDQLDGEKSILRERKFIRKDGSMIPVEVSGIRMKNGNYLGIVRDVTERLIAEQNLKESEERHRGIVEQSLTGIYIIQDDYFIYTNPQFASIFGYTQEEMLNSIAAIDVVYEPDREMVRNTVLQRLAGKDVKANYSFRGVKKDGTVIHVEVFGAKAMHAGQPVTVGTLLDVTDRKRAEAVLQKSEKFMSTLTNSMSDGVFTVKLPERRIEFINQPVTQIFGYSADEVLGQSTRMFYPDAEGFKAFGQKLKSALVNGETQFRSEMELVKKNGERFWAEIAASFFQVNGGSKQVMSIIRDITERKKYEQALIQSEANAKILFDYSSIVIWEEDFSEVKKEFNRLRKEGVTDFRKYFHDHSGEVERLVSLIKVIQVNFKSIEFFGAESREELDTRIPAWFRKDSWPAFTEELVALAEGELRFESEIPVYSPHDGKQYHLLFSLSVPPVYRDTMEKVLVSFIDITDRKKAANEIAIMNKQLQELSRHLQKVREEERAALARDLHDELGQQLTAIKMDISWIASQAPDDKRLKSKIDETLELTKNAVSAVRRINADLRPSLLDDLGLFAALEYQMDEFGSRYGITCELKFSMEEPKMESQKAIAIFRVFQESLTNIARHAKAKKVNSIIRQQNGSMELIITDDGVGFTENESRNKKSFGILGMKERAMMMNGTLKVKSKPGKGTTLHLSVPV